MTLETYNDNGVSGTLNPMDFVVVALLQWRWLVFGPMVVGILAYGASYLVAPTYTASTKFLPPQQQQSAAATMIQNLGSLGALAGTAAGLKNAGDQYVSFLKSRSIQDVLIERFNLKARYGTEVKEETYAALSGSVRASSGKDGLITIEVDDKDPKFSAQLANAHVDELGKLLGRLAVTEAQQRRLFFEKQLQKTKTSLVAAEQALKKIGLSDSILKATPAAAVSAVAELHARITAQEVKIASMRGYLTESAPEFKQAQSELSALKAQANKFAEPSRQAVDGNADYVSLYREVKYYETLFELFAKQFELAKIDESREGALIQVLDPAFVPERKSKPQRVILAATASLVTMMALILLVFGRHAWVELKKKGKLTALERSKST